MSLALSRRRSEGNFRYRIGVINDFRDSYAFIEYKEYGTLKIFDACRTSGVDRKEDGSVAVFLNFKKVGQFKSKSEAVSLLKKLLAEAALGIKEINSRKWRASRLGAASSRSPERVACRNAKHAGCSTSRVRR